MSAAAARRCALRPSCGGADYVDACLQQHRQAAGQLPGASRSPSTAHATAPVTSASFSPMLVPSVGAMRGIAHQLLRQAGTQQQTVIGAPPAHRVRSEAQTPRTARTEAR